MMVFDRTRACAPLLVFTLVVLGALPARAHADERWKAGVARAVITPQGPLWMAGYGARKAPSTGAIHDLWTKAVAIQDPAGDKGLLITLDICGIDRGTAGRIAAALERQAGLTRERIVIACSHTHCGPVVGANLEPMYPIDAAERKRIADYTSGLEQKVVATSLRALGSLAEANLAFGTGRAGFAVNRRENREAEAPAKRAGLALVGPVDHDVPVLRIERAGGGMLAVVYGYACHCTTLDINKFSGDYAGFTSIELEKAYPGATALFVAGCGADQNPIPRRALALAERYGHELAVAVRQTLAGPLRSLEGKLTAAYREVPLEFAALPSRSDLTRDMASSNFYIASRAKLLNRKLDAAGSLAAAYPYPVQAWKLGELDWIFLGGEVVVDYALRIKRNLDPGRTGVSAYCNDVMAYIPSRRVLKEGGYEGGGAMLYYGLPSPWRENVEEAIIGTISRTLQSEKP